MFLLIKKSTLVASALLLGMSLAGDALAGAKRTNPEYEPVRVNPVPKAAGNKTFGTQFQQTCYQGFYKGPKVMKNSAMIDYYICYSDVIYCPPFFQKNDGRWANVHPRVIVKQIGGNPESGQAKRFQIQYKCDYSPNYKPEG